MFGTGYGSRYAFRFALIGMILTLCLCVNSWGACTAWNHGGYNTVYQFHPSGYQPKVCVEVVESCQYCSSCRDYWSSEYCSMFHGYCEDTRSLGGGCPPTTYSNGRYLVGASEGCPYTTAFCNTASSGCDYQLACDTQAEADSVANELNKPPIDSTACDSYRDECESIGGKFTGNVVSSDVSETGCLSFCDMCNSVAQNNYRRSRAVICCSEGKVPPLEVTSCANLELTGDPDMSFSSFDCDNQGGFDCDCQDINSENASIYNSVCNENQWEEPNSAGSGSDESSSSAENPEASSGSGDDWEYDYRDSLKRIIKYDSLTLETNRAILTCLTNPSACGSVSASSSQDYTSSLNDIKHDVKKLDTTFSESVNSLKNSISDGNDSLIDSIRKFISMNSFSFSGDTLGDSLGKIHGTLEQIRGILSGNGTSPDLTPDYGGFGNSEIEGKNIADSIRNAVGFGGLDSIDIDGRFQAGLDSANSGEFQADSVDFQNLHDSLGQALEQQVKDDKDHLPDTLDKYADSLISYAPFGTFDSLIYSTLGSRIPNKDQCPDDCFKWSVNIASIGLTSFDVDYGVCLGRVPLGGMNALSFIRLIVRLFVVVSCIWMVVWNFTKKKE